MKKVFALVFVAILATSTSTVIAQQQPSQERLINDAFITTLNPYIEKAITQYFGYPKQYGLYDIKLLEIKRPNKQQQYTFEVKVKVSTFEHAHNPPYTKETITLTINPSEIKVINYEHLSDELEKKIEHFKNELLKDIVYTFNLDLKPYKMYEYKQLLSQAEQKNLKQLAKFNENIVINELNKDITPPYKNVADPFTFVKDDKAYIVYKKADGTNVLYTMRKENGNWINVMKETKQGKVMLKELLWYMFKQLN